MKALTVSVDGSGRILLPAKIRKELDLGKGSVLTVDVTKEGLVLRSRAQAIQRAQEYFSRFKPKRGRASDELIRERRREARREWSS
jgi:AbrB family looped-hinge helix DNA binding protein